MTARRHQSREAAFQVLYLWQVGGMTAEQALGVYFREHDAEAPDDRRAFVRRIVEGVTADPAALDQLIEAHATNWRLDRIAVVDRQILRLATWELRHDEGTPPAVVIDEAVELARSFGGDESPRFVNGVLDAIRRSMERDTHVERS